jgi:hypothetical protein
MYKKHVKLTNINSSTQQPEFSVLAAVHAGGGYVNMLHCYGRLQKDKEDWITKVPGRK